MIKAITEKCWEFWSQNVLANKAPEPVNIDDIKRLFKIDSGEMIEATNDLAAGIGELKRLKDQEKGLKEQQGAISMQIAECLKERTGITIAGEKALTFKAYDKRTFNTVR